MNDTIQSDILATLDIANEDLTNCSIPLPSQSEPVMLRALLDTGALHSDYISKELSIMLIEKGVHGNQVAIRQIVQIIEFMSSGVVVSKSEVEV